MASPSTLRVAALTALVAGFSGCKRPAGQADSQVKVTNGEDAEGKHPAVVKLTLLTQRARGTCTGTFVDPRIVITAAHCITDVEGISVDGVTASWGHANPLWSKDDLKTSGYDVAVIGFDRDVASATLPLSTREPRPGEQALIVGYGFTDWAKRNDSGVKRQGTTTILELAPLGPTRVILSQGWSGNFGAPGTEAAVGKGDSGGPLLLDGKIVGVASLGGPKDDRSTSVHALVLDPKNLAFLREATGMDPSRFGSASGPAGRTGTARGSTPLRPSVPASPEAFGDAPITPGVDADADATEIDYGSACTCGVDPQDGRRCAIYKRNRLVQSIPWRSSPRDCERLCRDIDPDLINGKFKTCR
jgi:hypothetical protein